MESMRATWTDLRLDDFAVNTGRRFDEVDRRLDEIGIELREVRGEMGALHQTIIQISAVTTAALIGVIAALAALIVRV